LWAINDMQPKNGSISGACDSNHMANASLGSHRHVLHYGPQARRVIPTGSHEIKPVSTQTSLDQSKVYSWSGLAIKDKWPDWNWLVMVVGKVARLAWILG